MVLGVTQLIGCTHRRMSVQVQELRDAEVGDPSSGLRHPVQGNMSQPVQ